MSESEIKIKKGFLPKKAVGRRKFTRNTYKSRWFILTEFFFKYYDGAHADGPRSVKSTIPLYNFRAVEEVEDASLDGKKNVFQVVFSEQSNLLTLYIVAPDSRERKEWILALHNAWKMAGDCDPNPVYHPQAWQKDRYPCCNARNKTDKGCCHTRWRGPTRGPLPAPPQPGVLEKRVIALYDRKAEEATDLNIQKGLEYVVLKEEGKWLLCRNSQGEEGWVPANFVQDKERYKMTLDKYDWFFGEIDRAEAANVLKADGRSGCFLVRLSATSKDKYTLCLLKEANDVRFYHIKQNEERLYYLSIERPFELIAALIDYHRLNPRGLAVRLQFSPTKGGSGSSNVLGGIQQLESREVLVGEEVGRGQFSRVNVGKYRGMDVAIKAIKSDSMSVHSFLEEAKTMSQLNHPHLVRFLGICVEENPLRIRILSEFMKHGSLRNYVKLSQTLSLRTMLEMALQVSKGMRYLERENYVHRDLAARNCLVGDHHEVKVCDFGLSRCVIDDEYIATEAKFPLRWSSREVLLYKRYSSKSDVWAFGVLLYEIFSGGQIPYGFQTHSAIYRIIAEIGCSLEKPSNCPSMIYDIMRDCWKLEAESRPRFAQLEDRLNLAIQSLT